MGVRTRGIDMQAGFEREAADRAARAEAEAVIQRWNDQSRPRHAVVADDPSGPARRHAMARRVLPGLRHEPVNRSAEGRPPSPRFCRDPGVGAALLVVPGVGADAQDTRTARAPARGEGRGVESVIGMPDCVRRTHGVVVATAKSGGFPQPCCQAAETFQPRTC